MPTPPQVNLPSLWFCEACTTELDVWDWTVRAEGGELGGEPRQAMCSECLIPLLPPERRPSAQRRYDLLRRMRQQIDPLLPATLIAFDGTFVGVDDEQFPSYVFAINVDWWDSSWPQIVLGREGTEKRLVVLAAYVSGAWDRQIALEFCWSWQCPEQGPSIDLVFGNADITESDWIRLGHARDAVVPFATPGPGRRKGAFKRSKVWYLDALRAYANDIRRNPTEKEFRARHNIDRKTLKRNLESYHLWPWEEFLWRGLSSSGARTITVSKN